MTTKLFIRHLILPFVRNFIYFHLPLIVLTLQACQSNPNESPYPPSKSIIAVEWDMSTHHTSAPGSDNWPMTWADDGHIYTSWGDGGGFNGTNKEGRVSLGVARIEGGPDSYRGFNVWGGKFSENPAQFPGKSYGILSVDGILYMWVNVQETNINQYTQCQLAYSNNHGATFTKGFKFNEPDAAFSVCTFLNFGQDYHGARDNYVYVYSGQPLNGCNDRCIGRDVFLARVPRNYISQRSSYEFFGGVENNEIVWHNDITKRKPVFSDPNGAGVRVGVSYDPGINRYILTISHNNSGGLGLFDAPEPWGPWTTVAYYENWLNYGYSPSYHLAPVKWMDKTGEKFVLVWSSNDMLNTMKATLTTSKL